MARPPYRGNSYNDDMLCKLAEAFAAKFPAEGQAMENAFKTKTFVYGTAGLKGGVASRANIMHKGLRSDNKLATKLRNQGAFNLPDNADGTKNKNTSIIFQAGIRQTTQQNGAETADFTYKQNIRDKDGVTTEKELTIKGRRTAFQMMDAYYGNNMYGGNLSERTDPNILLFVMYAIKFKFLPGWEQYNTWSGREYLKPRQGSTPYDVLLAMEGPDVDDGWGGKDKPYGWYVRSDTTEMYGYDDWGQLPMTLTKEISRIIRWGIGEYGGKILFEGADVYYSQVFGVGEKLADTDLEARILLGFFDKKSIQEGKFTACIGNPDPKSADKGKGEVEFYWHGKPTAPSKLLFLTSWTWQKNSRSHELIQPESFGEPLESLKDKVRYNSNFTPQKYGNITRERNNFFTGSYQFNYTSGDTIFQAINNYNPIAHIETNQKLFLQVWEDIWENRIPTFPPGLPSFPDRKKDIYNIAEWLQNLKNPPTDDLYERVIVNGKTTWQLKGDRLVDPLDPNRNELEEYGKWSEYAPHTAKSDYLVEIFPKYAQEALLKYDQQIKGFFTRQSAESRAASRVLKESLKYDTNPVNFLNLVCWLIGEEATPVNVMIKKGLSRPLKKDSRLCGLLKEAHHNWQIYVKANQYNAKKLKSENHKEMYLNWTLKKIET